jgi:hypothetical protein
MPRPKNNYGLFLILTILLSLVSFWYATGHHNLLASEYKIYSSPDGKYTLVVYRIPLLIAMPGGGSDASGYVRIYDAKGKVLCDQEVSLVRDIKNPEWRDRRVIAQGVDCRLW